MHPTWPFIGRTRDVIASPPCQAWSVAGRRLGLLDQPLVHTAVEDLAAGRDTRVCLLAACRDERFLLAAELMRYLHAPNTVGEPDWIAMEEVPDVLPLWKQYAAVLRGWGFSVWCGIINAADFGVSQTRKRAILLASRVRTAQPPAPTHAQVHEPDSLFGPGRARWVSMAEALGWGATDHPVPTVCAGGGPEPFPSGSRKALSDARERGTWAPRADGVVLQSRRRETAWTIAAYETPVSDRMWVLTATSATPAPVLQELLNHLADGDGWDAAVGSPVDEKVVAAATQPLSDADWKHTVGGRWIRWTSPTRDASVLFDAFAAQRLSQTLDTWTVTASPHTPSSLLCSLSETLAHDTVLRRPPPAARRPRAPDAGRASSPAHQAYRRSRPSPPPAIHAGHRHPRAGQHSAGSPVSQSGDPAHH